jgi:hypothetical protein
MRLFRFLAVGLLLNAAPRAAPSAALPDGGNSFPSCVTNKDYVSAMLDYDRQLQKDPFNHELMEKLVACHEAMLRDDEASNLAKFQKKQLAHARLPDDMPELPRFSEKLDTQVATSKP